MASERDNKKPPAEKSTGENWLLTSSSKSLSGRPSRNTGPELLLRRALHRRGLRYRLHTRIGERLTLDIDFIKARIAVFADGCYWHGCPDHPRTPTRGPNKAAWDEKFRRVAQREQRAGRLLAERGYLVFRIRECLIADDVEAVAAKIEAAVRRRAAAGGGLLQQRAFRIRARRHTGVKLRRRNVA